MLSSGELQTIDLKPVLQVVDIQPQTPAAGGGGGNDERYTVLLSDGLFHRKMMLATRLSELVRSQQLQKGSIVQLTEFVCDSTSECMTIIINELDVIRGICDIIGDPKSFSVTQTYIHKTISQIKDEKLGTFGKPDLITVNATIWYLKCCKNRVNYEDEYDQIIDESDYRYTLHLMLKDHTGFTFTIVSQEIGEKVFGVSAKALYLIKEQDEDMFADIVREFLFHEYCFKLEVKEEFFVDELRVMSTIVDAEKIEYSSGAKGLLTDLDKNK